MPGTPTAAHPHDLKTTKFHPGPTHPRALMWLLLPGMTMGPRITIERSAMSWIRCGCPAQAAGGHTREGAAYLPWRSNRPCPSRTPDWSA